jgi:hypothetical protein
MIAAVTRQAHTPDASAECLAMFPFHAVLLLNPFSAIWDIFAPNVFDYALAAHILGKHTVQSAVTKYWAFVLVYWGSDGGSLLRLCFTLLTNELRISNRSWVSLYVRHQV